MKKIVSVVAFFALLAIGFAYAISYSVGNANVLITESSARDFERNVYIADIKQESKIIYSIVQSKDLVADLNGISPSYVLARQGDTVKLAIKSDVNCNFIIDGYNIRARTMPDTTTELQFNADLAGIYPYRCDGFLSQNVGFIEVVE